MSSRRASQSATGRKAGTGAQQDKQAARGAESSERKPAKAKEQAEPSSKAKASRSQARGKQAQARKANGAAAPGRRSRTRGSRAKAAPREISAGGVVVRRKDLVVIVPTRRAADGSRVLSLPKGHVDPGETPVQAAQREVREEAGVVAEPVRELGESRYWYRRDGRTIGKSVHFYLFRYVSGDTADHDDEVEEARWLALTQAAKQLTYPAEREMVVRAMEHLKEGERKDR